DPLPSRQRCRAGPESGPSKSLLRIAAHTCTVTPRTGTGSARLVPRRGSFPQARQMIPSPQSLATVSGTALAALAAGYTALAGIALRRPANPGRLLARQPEREAMPAVTILKPLCGAEHGLYERLRSFCEQRYPDFQIVFGVRDPGDPALTAVRRSEERRVGKECRSGWSPSRDGDRQ